jgi:hypothetical protein
MKKRINGSAPSVHAGSFLTFTRQGLCWGFEILMFAYAYLGISKNKLLFFKLKDNRGNFDGEMFSKFVKELKLFVSVS